MLADIAKLNVQIAQTDSLTKAEKKFNTEQAARQQADIKRRKSEIEDLNQKLAELNAEMKREKNSISNAQTKAENVNAVRKSLTAQLSTHCAKLEEFVKNSLPWDTEARIERISALCADLQSGSSTAEEGFARLKALYTEEIRMGDEVQMSSRAITRNNGEMVNANVLKIGNQWIVYQDDAGLLYGVLKRKKNAEGKYEYLWQEDLSFEERQAVKTAVDVKLSRKPPQMVVLPLSLSIATN